MAAGFAFIFVDRHRFLRENEYHATVMGSRGAGGFRWPSYTCHLLA
jgi:hypothetical protein